MNPSLPTAQSAASPEIRTRILRLIEQRNLCGLANDTKWNELISLMRAKEGWKPHFRCKCIDGTFVDWDREWFYHLPFPLLSLEWLDLSGIEKSNHGKMLAPTQIDHSEWIKGCLRQIGFDYQKGRFMVRIFGYSPKSHELFDQSLLNCD